MDEVKKYIKENWIPTVLFVALLAVVFSPIFYKEKPTETPQENPEDKNYGRIGGVLPYPLPKNDRRVIENATERFVDENIFDIIWDDFYNYTTYFESLDGFDTSLGTTSQLTAGAFLQSPGTGVGTTTIFDTDPNPTSFTAESRFQVMIFIGTTTDQTVFLTVGSVIGSSDAYGFLIDDATLFGIAQINSTSRSTINLGITIQDAVFYLLEARYIPNQVVQFYVSENADVITNKLVLRGVLRSNLPVDDDFSTIFYASIAEKDALIKDITINSYRYMQKRFQR